MRHLRLSIGLAAVAISSGLVAAGPAAPAQAAAPVPAYLLGVDCGTTSFCETVGGTSRQAGAVAGTTDGGRTWVNQQLPAGVTFDDKLTTSYISCPSSSTCSAVGYRSGTPIVVRSTTKGRSWSVQRLLSTLRSVQGIDCPSSSICQVIGAKKAGGYAVIRTSNGGRTWSGDSLPAAFAPMDMAAISCGSTTHCQLVAADQQSHPLAAATTNGGKSWRMETLPSAIRSNAYVGSVSCASASRCVALGSQSSPDGMSSHLLVLATTSSGASWTVKKLAGGSWSGVRCGSPSACQINMTTAMLRIGDHGQTWTRDKVPSGFGANDVACPTANVCMAVGATRSGPTSWRTANAGTTWVTSAVR